LPQLDRLQNPHRNGRETLRTNGQSDPGTPSQSQFYELSLELADMVQMAIQTLLQISPPQVLEPTREQFSACALSVPTPSMSAMFTAMRNLNYFSANMGSFWQEPPEEVLLGSSGLIAHSNFDLGELLQSVGDVMSGAAAEAGVDLVLYHGDLSLKNAWVSGSESGLTVALSHVSLIIFCVHGLIFMTRFSVKSWRSPGRGIPLKSVSSSDSRRRPGRRLRYPTTSSQRMP
jgi:osomolarity two-component system response regulator SSK1